MLHPQASENLIIGVKALVFSPERDRVLFLRRTGNEKLTLPGGRVDDTDTSLLTTYIRELQEETDVEFDNELGLQLYALHVIRLKNSKVLRAIGHMQAHSSAVELRSDEHNEALWVPTTDLASPRILGRRAMEGSLIRSLPVLFDKKGNLQDYPLNASAHVWPLPAVTLR